MKEFIKLEDEYGNIVIERVSQIESMQLICDGVRIWWKGKSLSKDYTVDLNYLYGHLGIC